MHDNPKKQSQPSGSEKPTCRVWLVQDREGQKPLWTELAGLWPTKSGNGHSGKLMQPVAALARRVVVLPADQKQEG